MLDGHSSSLEHLAQNVSLILLSLCLLPLSTFVVICSYVVRSFLRLGPRIPALHPDRSKTILVTGVGMAKGLALARTFHEAGHRVIGADFEPDGVPVNGRGSTAIDRFYKLPTASGETGMARYIDALLGIVKRERVDVWVSCSSVVSSIEDGEAAEIVEQRTGCRVIQFHARLTETLHEKHSFIQHTASLGLNVPETHQVTTRGAVHKVLNHAGTKRYIMKSVGTDDATRGNLTLLPRPTISETYHHLSGIDISTQKPWVLQQFIVGDEYCTHALVVNSEVKAFVACPSSELLMYYQALPPQSSLSQAMLEYTREFVARTEEPMTGHLSFDFLVEEKKTERGVEKILFPIECNPRAHTAVVLFDGTSREMADAYLSVLKHDRTNGVSLPNGQPETIVSPRSPKGYYWIGHDLVTLVFHPLLHLLRAQISSSDFFRSLVTFLTHLLFWKDGSFESWDPLPWWWLYHVYWPGKFLVAVGQRKWWSRVNVSTTKMFAC
ncbi:MAG: hypothetical protein M1817_006341 [Caeruleum heppii]|nr:MAG: hypothetical protein M1817_006341 [Caeruleum heppii]